MSDRIEVNGVWYVREDSLPAEQKSFNINDIIWFEGCLYEDDKYCFEFSKIRKSEDGPYYNEIDVKFTDKRGGKRDTWVEEHWDNNYWFFDVLNNKPESLSELDHLCQDGIFTFKSLLQHLVDKQWLINDKGYE